MYRTTLMLILSMLIVSCNSSPNVRPDDFRIEYHSSNGTVGPSYHYGYEVIVDSNGHGQVILSCDCAWATNPYIIWSDVYSH